MGIIRQRENSRIVEFDNKECCIIENDALRVTIPDGVTRIEAGVFAGLCHLRIVSIPDSVRTIEKHAFLNCGLRSISIPAGVRNIEPGAFEGCGLAHIKVDPANKVYDSRNDCNCIIETRTQKIVQGSEDSTMPANIKIIGEKAFKGICCNYIGHFPSTLVKIEDEAFENAAPGLYRLTFPKSLKSIGRHAFDGVELGSIEFRDGLETIGDGAFRYVKDYLCGIREIRIPKSVKSIGTDAFAGHEIDRISVKPGNRFYYSSGNCLVEKSTGTLVLGCTDSVIPEGVRHIGAGAFAGCPWFTTPMVIPEGVKTIGKGAFPGCEWTTEITVPGTVRHIEAGAFGPNIKIIKKSQKTDKVRQIRTTP